MVPICPVPISREATVRCNSQYQRPHCNFTVLLQVLVSSANLRNELDSTPPEYVMLVDSEANVEALRDRTLKAHVTDL